MAAKGQPLSIVYKSDETKNFELDEAALARLLLRADVKDKPVCVVAVAGGFRKGKSFLLDYFLRYCANRNKENWLGDPSDPLEGFHWANGYERETTGMLVWSEPFFVNLDTGEEVAIILIDTQGTFDSESSMKESTIVFSLSLLVSSVLVYNLKENIGEDDLMNLQTFIKYGLFAHSEGDESAAFQKLMFLVRDWSSPSKLAYGLQGGQELLKKRLEIKPDQDPVHQNLRRDICKCFSDISCYLMPHPGPKVQGDEKFDGRHAEIEGKFLAHLKILAQLMLAPKNIEQKNGFGRQTIKAKDLFRYFRKFVELFKSDDLPEPTTLVECMAKASFEAALAEGKELYAREMHNVVAMNYAYQLDLLEISHKRLQKQALDLFKMKINFRGKRKELYLQCQKQLVKETEAVYNSKYKPLVSSQVALEIGKKYYCQKMNLIFRDGNAVLTEEELRAKHSQTKKDAVVFYKNKNTFGKDHRDVCEKYKDLLKKDIDEKYVQFQKSNEDRRVRQKALQERDDAERSKKYAQVAATVGMGVAVLNSGAVGAAKDYFLGAPSGSASITKNLLGAQIKTDSEAINLIGSRVSSSTAQTNTNILGSSSSFTDTVIEYFSLASSKFSGN